MKGFLMTARLCLRNRSEFGLVNTLGQYLIKLLTVLAQCALWRAILPEGATVEGMNRRNMVVYIAVSSALAPLLDVRTPASSWLHDGTMLGLFQLPRSVYGQLAAHAVGGWLTPLLLYGLPLLLLSSLMGYPPVPASAWFWPSLLLCVSQGFAVDYLYACLMIRMNGVEWAMETLRTAVAALLTGGLIPFAALPWGLGRWLELSPLGTLAGAPLALLTGLGEPARLVGAQVLWNITLWPLALWAFGASRERMVSYGG